MSITVSVISHGHGAQVAELLGQLADLKSTHPRRVIVTVNVPEPELLSVHDKTRWPFELRRVDNRQPVGFGANHNRAFELDEEAGASTLFAVVNPDVRLVGDPFPALIEALAQDKAGCAYPLQIDERGNPRDHERILPSPPALFRRYLGPPNPAAGNRAPDWVNAAFLLFPREVFARLGGFDTRYHMYCEDVDICLRLQLLGFQMARATGACVIHSGRRATRTSGRHLLWHVASLWRLWTSDSYRDFKRRRINPTP